MDCECTLITDRWITITWPPAYLPLYHPVTHIYIQGVKIHVQLCNRDMLTAKVTHVHTSLLGWARTLSVVFPFSLTVTHRHTHTGVKIRRWMCTWRARIHLNNTHTPTNIHTYTRFRVGLGRLLLLLPQHCKQTQPSTLPLPSLISPPFRPCTFLYTHFSPNLTPQLHSRWGGRSPGFTIRRK